MLSRVFYNIFIAAAQAGVRVYALFNEKARRALEGRRGMFERLETLDRPKRRGRGSLIGSGGAAARNNTIWFHASSMGEFEQARPLIEELRRRNPSAELAVSFFSPSGFDNHRSYKHADIITYIPFDSPANAARFVKALDPAAAVVMRYDVWPNHIRALSDAGVRTALVNATMAPGSPRFYFRGFHRDLYRRFDRILAVSERDREQFLRFGVKPGRITAAGDTRFDQVIARCRESATHDLFPDSIFKDRTVLVAGSTWPKDEEYLIAAIAEAAVRHLDLVAIVVPHEPTEKHLQEFEEASRGSLSSIRFSRMASYNGERVILVDGMGMLVTMYKYAHVVYVGGGFGAGIHNVLEPAVYGVPVLIGPNHQSSNEARALLERRGIAACDGRESMAAALGRFLADPPGRRTMGEIAKQYVNEKAGATEAIVSYLLELK